MYVGNKFLCGVSCSSVAGAIFYSLLSKKNSGLAVPGSLVKNRVFLYNFLIPPTKKSVPAHRKKTSAATRKKALLLAGIGACLLVVIAGRMLSLAGATVDVSLRVVGGVLAHIKAIPEKRIPVVNNRSTILTVEVRNPGSLTPLDSVTITTGPGGSYSGVTLAIDPGTYDVTAKGYSHLRRKKSNVAVTDNMTIDFSDNNTFELLSGDVNSTVGDNLVNGIDLSLIVGDLTETTARYDLNQDGVINGIDLTNAVTNLTVSGDA